jgi:hypothetical protein
LSRLHEFSRTLHGTEAVVKELKLDAPEIAGQLEQVRWRLMRAETSCNLYWGEAWVHRIHADLDEAQEYLNQVAMTVAKLPRPSPLRDNRPVEPSAGMELERG